MTGQVVYVQTTSILGGTPYGVLDLLWDMLAAKMPAGLDPVLEQRLLKDEPAKGWVTLVLEGTGPAGLQMPADGPGDVGIWAEGVQGGSGAVGGLAGHPGNKPMELCRVFWGSHGCSLERGHAGHRHECGDSGGPCCQLEQELDEITCEVVWVQRFADEDGNWTEPYPGLPFGEDLPVDLEVSLEAVDMLRAEWQAAGKLAVWVEGQGWVKKPGAGSGIG